MHEERDRMQMKEETHRRGVEGKQIERRRKREEVEEERKRERRRRRRKKKEEARSGKTW